MFETTQVRLDTRVPGRQILPRALKRCRVQRGFKRPDAIRSLLLRDCHGLSLPGRPSGPIGTQFYGERDERDCDQDTDQFGNDAVWTASAGYVLSQRFKEFPAIFSASELIRSSQPRVAERIIKSERISSSEEIRFLVVFASHGEAPEQKFNGRRGGVPPRPSQTLLQTDDLAQRLVVQHHHHAVALDPEQRAEQLSAMSDIRCDLEAS